MEHSGLVGCNGKVMCIINKLHLLRFSFSNICNGLENDLLIKVFENGSIIILHQHTKTKQTRLLLCTIHTQIKINLVFLIHKVKVVIITFQLFNKRLGISK